MTLPEFGTMNSQMEEMKRMSQELRQLIDREMLR